VQQLLDFARLEPGVQSEPFVPVDLARLVRDVVARYSAQAPEVDLGADTPPSALTPGSEAELSSLIENLVDNALRYAPAGSAVTVSVKPQGERIELAIVDAGRGIPESERERVFERFHRVPGDSTRGTGLGLAIVKAIVERHQGTIALADAQPGGEPPGLAVRIELPGLPESQANQSVAQSRALKSSLSLRAAS
jgi:signal transduction histidine kinase